MTSFFTIMPYVRTVLADTQEPYMYSDETIISAMQMAILGMDGYSKIGDTFVKPSKRMRIHW